MISNIRETIENPAIGESYTKITHKSGLEIYAVKKNFSSFYAIFGTRYGSFDNTLINENGEKTEVPEGIAHFLEHKLFESEEGTDAFEDFSAAGADANAFTSTDMTAYLFSCTDEFYTSLETLINMVLTPHFTPENVAKEQGIIGQEIKMCEDRPSEALHYNLLKALYKKNPIRIPIAGTVESIALITPELLYDCYRSYYRMSNMTLCVCGDIDVDRIAEIVDRLVPEKNEGSVVFTECKEDAEVNERTIRVEMDVAKPLFKVGIKFPEGTPENDAVCAVLSETLFGESEDFFSELYEDGLISSYSNYYDSSRSASHFVFGGDSDDPEEVFKRFLAYMERIRKNGVSPEAVERSKRVLYAEALRGYDSTENVVMNLFESFITGVNGLECAEKYMKVTLDDVSALLPLVLDEKRFAMSAIYPKNTKE